MRRVPPAVTLCLAEGPIQTEVGCCMKKQSRKKFCAALGLLGGFVLWTAAICLIDVRPIGPRGSAVGFAGLNRTIHELTGVHMSLYTLTDWLGLVPVAFMLAFALLGLIQWIRRRHILKVDRSVLVLGGFYLAVLAAYLFFEWQVINYRPVLIEGFLEASYPSSTTMLTLCVMPTAWMQLRGRIRHRIVRSCVAAAISVFTAFMVIGRLISGVHWVTDVIGGVLLSGSLVLLYAAFES